LDGGQVLGQAVVPILKNDDAKSLAARVLIKEHCLYPLVLRRVMTGNDAPVYLT
jgi:phosphoribosylglycinamide formyltransferase-1